MPPSHSVTASSAKLRFGELLGRCIYGGEEVVITKHDKPVAVIVRMEDWQARRIPSAKAKPDKTWGGRAYEELPPVLRRISDFRHEIMEYQRRHGIKDNISAVKLIRMIRDDDE